MIDQLVRIYLEEEGWHETKLSQEEAEKYFKVLIEKGRILSYTHQGSVVGYVETWRINYEQLGRIICKAFFSAYLEDVETGNICYVANTWIHKDFRWQVHKTLKRRFFEQNKDCEYFVGDARRKATGLIKVFKGIKGGNYGWRKTGREKRTSSSTADYSTANA